MIWAFHPKQATATAHCQAHLSYYVCPQHFAAASVDLSLSLASSEANRLVSVSFKLCANKAQSVACHAKANKKLPPPSHRVEKCKGGEYSLKTRKKPCSLTVSETSQAEGKRGKKVLSFGDGSGSTTFYRHFSRFRNHKRHP